MKKLFFLTGVLMMFFVLKSNAQGPGYSYLGSQIWPMVNEEEDYIVTSSLPPGVYITYQEIDINISDSTGPTNWNDQIAGSGFCYVDYYTTDVGDWDSWDISWFVMYSDGTMDSGDITVK